MSNVRLENIQQTYLNGNKVTMFHVYSLKNNTWTFDYSDYIFGWFKRESTILNKHIAFNNQ